MIMAGRGRRLGDIGIQSVKTGSAENTSDEVFFDLPKIIEKIENLNPKEENGELIKKIEKSLRQLCPTKEELEKIISQFYNKGLEDSTFGEKILSLKEIFGYEVDGQLARYQFLISMQRDFDSKDTLFKSDHKKFLSAIVFLGNAYNYFTIQNHSIDILGTALFDYLELLVNSEEDEDFKILTEQIVQNGKRLSEETNLEEKYNNLQHNLRNTLINKNLSTVCKKWILFCIDFMSNNFKPLPKMLNNFYRNNLGDDYSKFESLIKKQVDLTKSFSSLKMKNTKTNNVDTGESAEDLKKEPRKPKFSDSIFTKSKDGTKNKHFVDKKKGQFGDKPKGGHKMNSSFVHDDRFEREENFYGVQTPRPPKTDNSKKNFQNKGTKKKELENKLKTGEGDSEFSQFTVEEES